MPIYEYRCKSCGKEFEVIQQFSDAALRKCRDCSGRLEKMISKTAFQLKGGGWYGDGYGGGGGGAAKPKTGTATTATDSGSSESSGTVTEKKKTSGSSKKD